MTPKFLTVKRQSEQETLTAYKAYVRAIWVITWKRQKWFGGDIIACWIPDWPLQN